MLNKDEIKGKAKQVKGTIKESLGWLTDDHQAEDEGKDERMEGEAQEHDAEVNQETDRIRHGKDASDRFSRSK
ncbi:MAG: CsbD family protein [Blastocatellia bacterium]